MPRPYKLGLRKASLGKSRAKIISAARDLLTSPSGFSEFTIDAVARQANVARMTVYNQFESKLGLLEAIFDDIGMRGGICELPNAFQRENALDALAEFIRIFGRFWTSERRVIKRLRGLAAIDPEVEQAMNVRDGYRREGVRVMVMRLNSELTGTPKDAVTALTMLTSFETFDALAGPRRKPSSVVPQVYRLVCLALQLNVP